MLEEFKILVNPQDKEIEICLPRRTRSKAEALEASIDKWKLICALHRGGVDYIGDGGISSCALCHKYYNKGCQGCPVKVKSGQIECQGTPYQGWIDTSDLKSAETELKFLMGLRVRGRAVKSGK